MTPKSQDTTRPLQTAQERFWLALRRLGGWESQWRLATCQIDKFIERHAPQLAFYARKVSRRPPISHHPSHFRFTSQASAVAMLLLSLGRSV